MTWTRTFPRAPPAGFEPSLPPPEGGALSPELRGPGWDDLTSGPGGGGNRHAPARSVAGASGRRKWVERDGAPPIPFHGEPRAALRPDRRVVGGPVRRRRDHASGRARDGHGGATPAEGAWRLRHERRAAA